MSDTNKNLEFIEDTHQYVYKGKFIPSVSELIRFKFPNAYKDIPTEILKKKATYGTKVHQTIEDFVRGKFTLEELNKKNIDPNVKISVEQFNALRKKWCFYIKDMEQMVCYRGKFAGTYDMLTEDGIIIDLKTTADLHDEWLAWQLGLYYLASGIENEIGYVIWLPKGKCAQVKPINVIGYQECKELVKDYEKHITK